MLLSLVQTGTPIRLLNREDWDIARELAGYNESMFYKFAEQQLEFPQSLRLLSNIVSSRSIFVKP